MLAILEIIYPVGNEMVVVKHIASHHSPHSAISYSTRKNKDKRLAVHVMWQAHPLKNDSDKGNPIFFSMVVAQN
jgi:hypothetical protein